MENNFNCSSLFSELDLQGQLSKAKNTNLYLSVLLFVSLGGVVVYCYYRITTLKNENEKLVVEVRQLKNP